MFAITSLPFRCKAGGRTFASLGAVKVTVKSAGTASPIGLAESALRPDGKSIETIKGCAVADSSSSGARHC